MEIDETKWSGDGDFTRRLLGTLAALPDVTAVRVEDAPASRSEPGYAFLSNEIYVAFARYPRVQRMRILGVIPWRRTALEPAWSLERLGESLAMVDGIGPADYADEGMLQYLRTERIVAPYQTRGIKLVELVRIYAAGDVPRR